MALISLLIIMQIRHNEVYRKGDMHSLFVLIVFSAPTVIISISSSLLMANWRTNEQCPTPHKRLHTPFNCCCRPCWMTNWTKRCFCAARSSWCSSTLFSVMNRRHTPTLSVQYVSSILGDSYGAMEISAGPMHPPTWLHTNHCRRVRRYPQLSNWRRP